MAQGGRQQNGRSTTKRQTIIRRTIIIAVVAAASIALLIFLLRSAELVVLEPAGEIAEKQRNLLIFASLLSLVVIIPVFALTFFIVWRYRESNHKATYRPNWSHSKSLEVLWWGIPIIIICVLAVVTWRSSHDLDPYKPLEATNKPLQIQVVALQWRWLFIYPEQNIASLNYVQFPERTPVEFTITADAPMNSFWIPQLGGQVYAMAGMKTKLHLIADEPGTYDGSSANLSGEGFASMRFTAESSSQAAFDAWVRSVRASGSHLDVQAYDQLAAPNDSNTIIYFSSREATLYDTVVGKYMTQKAQTGAGH